MERFIIYLATNIINKKRYVGYSEQALEERRNEHIAESDVNKPSWIFHKAMKKYGFENFHWCILDRSAKTLKELKELEKKYIAELDTMTPKGYNMTPGGDGCWGKGETKETNEIIKRMSVSLKESYKNPEIKKIRLESYKKISKSVAESHKNPTQKMLAGRDIRRLKKTGQTKENNASVRRMAEKKLGRNKTNDPSMAAMADKLRGRRKEDHPYLAKMAMKLKGRTKKTHAYLAIASEKRKGWTKETHPCVAATADKLRGRTKETHEGNRRQAEKIRGRKASPETLEKQRAASSGQNNPMSRTNIEKRKFKKEYPELFTFNKEMPPVLPSEVLQYPLTIDNIIQGRNNNGSNTFKRLVDQS